MKLKFSEKKEEEETKKDEEVKEEKKEEKTVEKTVEKTEEEVVVAPDKFMEAINAVKAGQEKLGEKLGDVNTRLDVMEEEKEEDFNSVGDDLFKEDEPVKEEPKTEVKEDIKKTEEPDLEAAIADEEGFRNKVSKGQRSIAERQDKIERKIDEGELKREVGIAKEKFPNAKDTDILRGIADDPNKSAMEIAEELSTNFDNTRNEMRKEIKEELEAEVKKEQKGNVSLPQTPGSKDSSTENPAEAGGLDPWQDARDKAKSEVEEE